VIRSCSLETQFGRSICAAFGIALMAGVMLTPGMAQDYSDFSRARDAELSRSLARAKPSAPRAVVGRTVPRQSAPGQFTPSRTVAARVLPARAAPARASAKFAPLPEGPLLLVVSLDKQRLSVYSNGNLVETTTVSTGAAGDPTPSGVFAVIEKQEKHFSNIFGGAPMPFMQRLTMSGVALHSGHVTGRPASHGCIRLPHDYARHLFQATRLGVRVIVSADDPAPVDVREVRLLDPALVAAAGTSSGILHVSTTSTTPLPSASTAVDRSIDPRTGKSKGPLSLLRDEMLKSAPVSLLVSRAEGRVYVRHMFEPQIDAEIAIGDPRQPIGTHVYTLTDMQPDGSEQRWSAVTVKLVPRRIAAIRVLSGRHSRAARAAGALQPSGPKDEGMPSTAAQAVQRFSLPPAIVAHIAPLIRPGLSIVVTDLPLSKRVQTGWTDIIATP
jgi:lipoprotein-anchoring transpeptidase ErfK/SrfK